MESEAEEASGKSTMPLFEDEEDDDDDSEPMNDTLEAGDSDDSEPMDDEVPEGSDSSDDDDDQDDEVCRIYLLFYSKLAQMLLRKPLS